MLESPPALEATVRVNRQLNQAVHVCPLPTLASITPEAWRRIHWTMVWVPPESSCRHDRATPNTIVQWPCCDTHAPITCALFANVIGNRARYASQERAMKSTAAVAH